MVVTDSIADMLTRIRNASSAHKETVDVPASRVKQAIANILLDEGYIKKVELLSEDVQGTIRLTLKYQDKSPVIAGIKRISRPGLKVYASCDQLPRVLGGLGIAIVSTSQGIMTATQARAKHIGGEVMAYVW
ncbi:30S ribosomal protein S8 [Amygdalobacter nucleatus]|uniref:Small ribosomal subunit protein uS8 n=1 Tax=Amygdalobacter nucleatus TaxID=3029274 RepID=A0A133Y726_9FIRM|nr:30S ribosomal protein S8 [Amygdalobacter nucleatus]KXB38953.1 ribosomal protein S8 [Amygdalobacter nucleatus]MDF0485305.1 30S ribosomal protein S8 [Amygdalobacter nucleatus]WEG36828.1 30S ribosomal protein S8 [Amygdalobacter nucleatus]